MKNENVRITNISIKNFKNVISGSLDLDKSQRTYKACILGIYGQNGSGKTALIDTIALLQHLLCGRSIPDNFADYINIDAKTASIEFEFSVGKNIVSYSFDIKSIPVDTEQNTQTPSGYEKKVCIFNEILKCSYATENLSRITTLIDTRSANIFSPKSKLTLLTGKCHNDTDLIVAKKMASISSRSFIFSRELLNAIRTQSANNSNPKLAFYSNIIENLVFFGNFCLFVINTVNSGLISLNTQTLVFKKDTAKGTMILPLNSPAVIPLS